MGLARPPQTIRVLALLIPLCFLSLRGYGKYGGGSGATTEPYQIATAEDLILLSESPDDYNKHFVLVDDISLNPKSYRFMQAVIAPDANSIEAGFQGSSFSGSLDGNHHVIRLMTIGERVNRADGDYLGLFGAIAPAGRVQRLGLVRASITGAEDVTVMGLLAARSAGTIHQCFALGTVEDKAEAIGGLVGHMTGGTIDQCFARASVGTGGSSGGLVGLLDNGKIANCYSTFRVMGGDAAGGLVGCMRGAAEIVHSYTLSYVGATRDRQRVGGLVGRKDSGSILGSFWNNQHTRSGNDNGTSLTGVEMQTRQTYLNAGWRFVDEHGVDTSSPWYMPPVADYPKLNAFRVGYPGGQLTGQGTPEHPYRITTAAELASISANPTLLDKCFELANDIDLDPNLAGGRVFRHAVIAPDIEPGEGFQGLGFAGRFDGRGHTLRNLTIQGGPGYHLGLFGLIQRDGYVHDLNLESVEIEGLENVGALAGISDGTIRTCRVSGTISGSGWFWRIGGLVGVGRGRVEGCHARVAIDAEDGCYLLGGMVGSNAWGSITESSATGSVSGGEDSGSLGGLAGQNSGTVQNCFASGAVAGGKDSHDLGGLVGSNAGSISQSYTTGRVAGANESERLGGLVGSNRGTLIDSYATGDVCGANRCRALGGLAGAGGEYSTMTSRCYACGRISSGNASGDLGGLIGYTHHVGVDRSGERIKNCFWDIEASGQPRSVGGTGLKTTRMQQFTTFRDAGWNMEGTSDGLADTWYMPADGGYPRLTIFAKDRRSHELAGLGTASRPYLISTPDDLAVMRRTGKAAYYRLTADIDLSGITWRESPLGNFSGAFDGNGYRISNVTIQDDSSNWVGFFEHIGKGARVFGLGLENVSISGAKQVGGLAAHCRGTIASCYVTGEVGSRADGEVGGLVGRNCGRILQSYARCRVTGFGAESALGALVGCNYSGAVVNCYATGPVSVRRKPKQSLGEATPDVFLGAAKEMAGAYNRLAGKNPHPYCECVWDFDRYGLSQSAGGYAKNTPAGMGLQSWLAEGWDFAQERDNGTVDLWFLAKGSDYPQLTIFSHIPDARELPGRGVPSDPYRIATAEDLGAIYYHDSTASYRLAADIDLSGITWSTAPIMEFHGQFDGAGYVIRNLTVRGDTDLGFFGEIGSVAVVKDLGIEDANFAGADQTQCMGILAAHLEGEIRNCYATGRIVTGKKSTRIGGLVGSCRGDLSNCWSRTQITTGSHAFAVGGLLGEKKTGKISACYATGRVRCGDEGAEIGGLIGTLFWYDNISDCYATTSIVCGKKTRKLGGLVGGIFQGDIIGHEGFIAHCYATGPVSADKGSDSVAGLLGSGAQGWDGAIAASYYSAKIRTSPADANEGTPLTPKAMKRQATFEGWDFESTWRISEGRDYPRLRWEHIRQN